MGRRCLIWAALESCASSNDEKIENDPERGDAENDGCNGDIDPPEVTREGTSEEQERNLQHQRQ